MSRKTKIYGVQDLGADDPETVVEQVGENAVFRLEKIPLSKLSFYTVQDWIDSEGRVDYMQALVRDYKKPESRLKIPPIVIRKADGGYDVLDGGHRVSAAAGAGLRSIAAFVLVDPSGNPDPIRRNSDENLRELERIARSGDKTAIRRYWIALARLGEQVKVRDIPCPSCGDVGSVILYPQYDSASCWNCGTEFVISLSGGPWKGWPPNVRLPRGRRENPDEDLQRARRELDHDDPQAVMKLLQQALRAGDWDLVYRIRWHAAVKLGNGAGDQSSWLAIYDRAREAVNAGRRHEDYDRRRGEEGSLVL